MQKLQWIYREKVNVFVIFPPKKAAPYNSVREEEEHMSY